MPSLIRKIVPLFQLGNAIGKSRAIPTLPVQLYRSNFTGLVRNCDESLLHESLGSGSFPDVLGDSINRRLVGEYRTDTIYDVWRTLATIVPVNDFCTQERARFGGYGDLPMVGEGSEFKICAGLAQRQSAHL